MLFRSLQFWEPGAPSYQNRYNSLKYAFDHGFKTSVSIEPFLDFNPIPLVNALKPYVSDTIWIGLMNYINRNGLSDDEQPRYVSIRKNYEYLNVQAIYRALKDDPKIRWKDSIKKMLNLS